MALYLPWNFLRQIKRNNFVNNFTNLICIPFYYILKAFTGVFQPQVYKHYQHLIFFSLFNVIVIGGGDTGVDCVGTCVRQVSKGLLSLELTCLRRRI